MTKEQHAYLQNFFYTHKLARFLAGLFASQIIWLYILFGLTVLFYLDNFEFVVLGAAALILGWGVLVHLISFTFPRKRPYQVFNFTPVAGVGLFSGHSTSPDSFPSGHTTAIASLTVLLYVYFPPLFWPSLVFLVLNIAGRNLLGFHWLRDSLAGLLLGLAAALCVLVARAWLLSVLGVFW
jgi:membrane-associated phospholipid phosphatase